MTKPLTLVIACFIVFPIMGQSVKEKHQLDSIITESYDNITSQWITSFKDKYTYDANGNKTLHNYYGWDRSLNKWVESGRSEYSYDAKENNTLNIIYGWSK